MSFPSWRLLVWIACATAVIACGGGKDAPKATPTPKPIPSPVTFAEQPALDFAWGDPMFESLPGATAHFGRLGGTAYQIEMPAEWNGRLVLFLHGSRSFEHELTVDAPGIRSYLIRNGYAWAASSYSSNVPAVAGLAADETAALWDKFTQQFGRPAYTYVTGQSLGGIASILSAEQYPDRYDGALPLCGAMYPDSFLDLLVAGAYVSGVTQQEFDSTPSGEVHSRIRNVLKSPDKFQQFRNLVVDLTGGPRPLADRGVDVDIAVFSAWTNSQLAVDTRIVDNTSTVYAISRDTGVTSDQFNESAIRVAKGPLYETFNIQPSGDIQIPVLTLNTTGETRIPIDEVHELQRRVDAAGRSNLLVQRTVRDPYHCGFTNPEWEQGFEDLVDWVEQGDKPKGEDVLNTDGNDLGKKFTLSPRIGLAEADGVPGADMRVTVSGTATLDGAPIDTGLITASVRSAIGLGRRCALEFGFLHSGEFELPLAADEEMRGCGQPGAKLFLVYDPNGRSLVSRELIDWPATGGHLSFNATFSSADPMGVGHPSTTFVGEALHGSGEHLEPGAVIEAFIGDTRCGVSSLPHLFTTTTDSSRYDLAVVSPELIPACQTGETITFRIDGEPVAATATHDLQFHQLELVLP